jgi:hypothetical protein
LKSQKPKPIHIQRNIFLKSKLRSLSQKWAPINEAYKLARIERGQYLCAICKKAFHYSNINKDHIEPVIPLTGAVLQQNGEMDWNEHIPRLLCNTNEIQIICTLCHDSKTLAENYMRVIHRDTQREKNKTKLKVDKKRK